MADDEQQHPDIRDMGETAVFDLMRDEYDRHRASLEHLLVADCWCRPRVEKVADSNV